MPLTRARTWATREASTRPGSSVTSGASCAATVITATSGGGGALPPAGAAALGSLPPPQAASSRASMATPKARRRGAVAPENDASLGESLRWISRRVSPALWIAV